ncbi:hypothetical protein [Nocardiopsis kunsanensis]|uniref:hypothetical protein n=1 Tax=Nocardiopsis kunsanensis TaxID=141693 RepID=UPI0027E581A3|nr:hypothetical protein [Nocardiopsis kunsanensis]
MDEARPGRVLAERVWPAVHIRTAPLDVVRWDAPGEPVPAEEGINVPYAPARVGQGSGPGPEGRPLYRIARADLAVFEPQVWESALDLQVAGDLVRELDTGDPPLGTAACPGTGPGRSGPAGDPHHRPPCPHAPGPVLASPATTSSHRVSAVGHAHIDSAWLHRYARPCARPCAPAPTSCP